MLSIRCLLVAYFTYSSVHMLMPISQFIPPMLYNAVVLFVLSKKNHLVVIACFESYSPLDMNALI